MKTSITLREAIELLRKHYGRPAGLPTSDPFELILWENVAYLATPARRLAAFEALKRTVGTSPSAILKAKWQALEKIAARGILKDTSVVKLRESARIALQECGGDLGAAIRGSDEESKRILRLFPGIGAPGAEKILLFAARRPYLAPDSNALRVLLRLGLVREDRSYARMYAAARECAQELPADPDALQEAHLLLQQHGQSLCKRNAPRCEACPLARQCLHASGARQRP